MELEKILTEISGQNVYLQINPIPLDFTDATINAELKIFTQSGKNFTITLNNQNLFTNISLLTLTLFSKGMKIITWNWKELATWILAKTKKLYVIDATIIDLKIIESYSGIKSKSPQNLTEALIRLKKVISSGVWKEIEPVYKQIHLPLMTTVIPHLETTGIIDSEALGCVFAHYEIDGQENGRLRCDKAFKHGFVPHAMSSEYKKTLKPRNQDELFMYFDFLANEVFVLAWLTKDPLLLEICKEKDVYLALFEKIVGKKAEKNDRNLAKKIFLPTIYGQSAYALSQNCNISIDHAETIIYRINALFPIVSTFFESHLKQLKENGYAKDYFGKRRYFEANKEHLIKNFLIQSPAATICLEKLIRLYSVLNNKTNLAYTIHDGYVVYAKKENWKSIYKTALAALSTESDFCSGLKLKVTVKAGLNLDNLKILATKGDI